MNKKGWLAALLALCMSVSVFGVAVGCGKTNPPDSGNNTENPDDNNDPVVPEKPAPTEISVTNDANPKPGAFELTVAVLPEGADASFTSALVGSHSLVSLVDNEVAISSDIEDKYEFTVEVTSSKAPAVKAQKTFVVDNRPADGLHITTAQRTIDATQNDGKLQIAYTVYPEAPVKFSLTEEVEGVSVSEGGLITLDKFVDNGISFTVKADAETEDDGDGMTASVTMTVKNEIEREISTEEQLRAIWKNYEDAQSLRNMKNFYKLTDNIRLTSAWTAIGFKTDTLYARFEGSFNGNGYTISNFNMNAGWNSGFFYVIGESGVVKNLTLESGKGEGEGLKGMFSAPFAGKCEGTIRDCVANVRVESAPNGAGVYQPIATFVGAVETTGKIYNCIALGQAIVDKPADTDTVKQDATRTSGFAASILGTFDISIRSSYALEGSSEYAIGHHTSSAVDPEGFFLSAEDMKKVSTYAQYDEKTGLGFDRNVWRIVEGAMPTLKNDKFVEPADINVTFGGETLAGEALTVRHGSYAVTAEVLDAQGGTTAPQAFEISLTLGEGVAEGAFSVRNGTVYADTQYAEDGDTCVVKIYSSYNPEVCKTVTLTFEEALAVIAQLPESVEYTKSTGTFDLMQLGNVQIMGGSDTTVKFEITNEPAGASITDAGVLTLTAACDNTAVIKIVITVSKGGDTASTDELSVAIVNKVPKEISTADEFLAIWTGNNESSRIHMKNNYVLMNDIDLGGRAIKIGLSIDDYTDTATGEKGYGLFGTLDGNGYELSWTNKVAVGWNNGFIAKIEKGGVLKNIKLTGNMAGTITGTLGLVKGTVENCIFNVTVESAHASQPSGSVAAMMGAGGVIRNVISVGNVNHTNTANANRFLCAKSFGTSAGAPATVANCYVLEGTVNAATPTDKEHYNETNVAVKTEAELKVAQTEGGIYEGWDASVWNFTEGAMPALRNGCSLN